MFHAAGTFVEGLFAVEQGAFCCSIGLAAVTTADHHHREAAGEDGEVELCCGQFKLARAAACVAVHGVGHGERAATFGEDDRRASLGRRTLSGGGRGGLRRNGRGAAHGAVVHRADCGRNQELVAGVGKLAAQSHQRGRSLVGRSVFPNTLDRETIVVADLFEGAEKRAEIVAVDTGGGAVFVLGEVGVVDRAHPENVVRCLTVAQHMEEIDEQFDRGMVGAFHGLGALDDSVDEIAFDAVERLDDEGDALGLGERGEEPESFDVLLKATGGRPALGHHAGTGAAEDHDRHPDGAGAAEGGVGVAAERGLIDGRTDDLEPGRQKGIRSRHGERAGPQRGEVRGESFVGGGGQEKVLHVTLDEIEVVGRGQSRERGGIKAEADLHREEEEVDDDAGRGDWGRTVRLKRGEGGNDATPRRGPKQ